MCPVGGSSGVNTPFWGLFFIFAKYSICAFNLLVNYFFVQHICPPEKGHAHMLTINYFKHRHLYPDKIGAFEILAERLAVFSNCAPFLKNQSAFNFGLHLAFFPNCLAIFKNVHNYGNNSAHVPLLFS